MSVGSIPLTIRLFYDANNKQNQGGSMSWRHDEHTCFGCPLKSVYTEMVNVPLGPESGDLANENIWFKVSEDQRLQQELSKSALYVSWINTGMGSANERRRYIVTSSLIGWTHTQNDTRCMVWINNCIHTKIWVWLLDHV